MRKEKRSLYQKGLSVKFKLWDSINGLNLGVTFKIALPSRPSESSPEGDYCC